MINISRHFESVHNTVIYSFNLLTNKVTSYTNVHLDHDYVIEFSNKIIKKYCKLPIIRESENRMKEHFSNCININ